ncbi:hypothetical protein, partial [Bradyrhizobium sp. NBAIM02]|uniref:hypothetical protein n=1 Tax=Bradyrhizobium sp. NBAIM02 TaxID=2793817 RepID=UPI001CD4F1B6
FRINAFWASENFEAFIVVAPPSRGIYAAPTLAKNGPVCRPQIKEGRTDEASKVHGRADYRGIEGA